MTDSILVTTGLSVMYGSFAALSDVSINVQPNTVHSIIGPNGAGKTTLFHALTGGVRPSSGRINLDGRDVTALSEDQRVRLGLARSFQVTSLFQSLPVRENLRLAAQGSTPWQALKFWRGPGINSEATQTTENLLDRLDLQPVAERAAGDISHGQQRRLEVGLALASKPRLVLLDEPTSGMGVDDIGTMKSLIVDLCRDHTVILIEHNMGIVMDISDTVTVMQSGRILVEGQPADIRNDPTVRGAYLGTMITGGRA